MNIYELLFYSCVVYNSYNISDNITTSCTWFSSGKLYLNLLKCENKGKNELETPIFSDIADNRKREKYRRDERFVID